MEFKDLSAAKCTLLTVHFATESNIKALHSFTPARPDALSSELVLRILLTYLPESLAPSEYTNYIDEVCSRLYLNVDREDVSIDTSPVEGLSDAQAEKKVSKLHLLKIQPPDFPPHAPKDTLTRFLCHRSYRIDEETGMVNLIPALVEPFLTRNPYLRTWYLSVVIPVLRLEFEYYPEDEQGEIGLTQFQKLEGKEGIVFLLSKADKRRRKQDPESAHIARDIKGLIGPWMYGHSERERRKAGEPSLKPTTEPESTEDTLATRVGKISLSGVQDEDKTGHDWEFLYEWLVDHARLDFPLITSAIEEWDGPGDIDLGGFVEYVSSYLDEDTQGKLELQYAQAAFAACYAVEADTEVTVRSAHGVLARLAELLDFIPPPDLASSVDSLPKIERHATRLDESKTVRDLMPCALLQPEHPLTTPRLETYMLLQMMVYSAYQFSGLGNPISIVNVAKLHFYATADEQLALLQNILRGLGKGGKRDDSEWIAVKGRLIWLWNWGIVDDQSHEEGAGVLGKINRHRFDEEMLKLFIDTSSYQLALETYITKGDRSLPPESSEQVVLAKALEAYDGASNGNRSRGSMKKANDVWVDLFEASSRLAADTETSINAFRSQFPESHRFREVEALVKATHSISFYSLTLQHGVPFQPVNIRVSQDPIGLLSKVLEQNPRSYTKLDDLTSIAKNLAAAGLPYREDTDMEDDDNVTRSLEQRLKDTERRVTFMAIESALRDDDFETAYSYIVNRLAPSPSDILEPGNQVQNHRRTTSKGTVTGEEDDISWRAALLAGRYRPATASPPTVRRLEQRTELLSLALLLAPTPALTEILGVWRRCEEETSALQAEQKRAEEEFDDHADKRNSGALPGTFRIEGAQPDLVLNQKRREVGRLQGKVGGGDEVPVSMFDLTRNAARAFSRGAFTSREAAKEGASSTTTEDVEDLTTSTGSLGSLGSGSVEGGADGQQRVRKRDMVANAASGALASGLGWVLGATPAPHETADRS